jgi:phospholipid/cholesterol/gamma-HCH transport system ATP-binding protein
MVTHELPSIFAIADNSVFLDADTKTAIAWGNPRDLAVTCPEVKVRAFLARGGDPMVPGAIQAAR